MAKKVSHFKPWRHRTLRYSIRQAEINVKIFEKVVSKFYINCPAAKIQTFKRTELEINSQTENKWKAYYVGNEDAILVANDTKAEAVAGFLDKLSCDSIIDIIIISRWLVPKHN